MNPVSCNNIHHDITDLVNHRMVKNTKTWLSWERNITFLWNKKILKLLLKWHILRSYCFALEVTFKICTLNRYSYFHLMFIEILKMKKYLQCNSLTRLFLHGFTLIRQDSKNDRRKLGRMSLFNKICLLKKE